MITLTARINLISGDNGTLSLVSTEPTGNNISSRIANVVGDKRQTKNPFILDASKLGEGATFSSGVDYFIGNQQSSASGVFASAYTLQINSANPITSLTIAFDTQNKRHPNSIKVDGVDYIDDDAIFTVVGLESSTSHTVVINNWNAPRFPLVISGIYVKISIDIDQRNLISLESGITYRADNKLPSYGIISNSGNIEFNDLDGEVRDYAEQMILTSDLKVVITLNNTLAKTHEEVGVFETRDWDYDNDNRSVSVSLKDDLEEWQDIQVKGFGYDPRNAYKVLTNGTMEDLYKWLQEKDETGNYRTPEKYQMLSFEQLDTTTRNILTNTKLQYPLLENGTLWAQWQKLCQVCGLYIYKDNSGNTVCRYTYGS